MATCYRNQIELVGWDLTLDVLVEDLVQDMLLDSPTVYQSSYKYILIQKLIVSICLL